MPWLHVKYNYFSRRRSSKIISKLFQLQWPCWKIFTSCN